MPGPERLPPLGDAFVSREHKQRFVRGLFAVIADRYDLITRLLSFGLDQRWKRGLVALSAASPGSRGLDLACGTGDITFLLDSAGVRATGIDLTPRMIELARRKAARSGGNIHFAVGDMMALPVATGSVDVVTTGYGIRNVPVIEPALGEIVRVLRPGGTFVSLDFNRPSSVAVRAVYLAYLSTVGAILGQVLHGNADTYRYIPESIRRYPGADEVCRLAIAAGFRECRWFRVLGGLMAVHRAVK